MGQQGPRIATLIRQVCEDPIATLHRRSRAARQLAGRGTVAVKAVLNAMSGPFPPDHHPLDVADALGTVLFLVARKTPQPLIDVIQQEAVPAEPQLIRVVSALAGARAGQVVDVLSHTLTHPNVTLRWVAARTLVLFRVKRAVDPLVKALRDRSPYVKDVVVEAMLANEVFRTPEAVEPLMRILENKQIKREWPGLWKNAGKVLKKLGPRAVGKAR